jgi:hypothetical protein
MDQVGGAGMSPKKQCADNHLALNECREWNSLYLAFQSPALPRAVANGRQPLRLPALQSTGLCVAAKAMRRSAGRKLGLAEYDGREWPPRLFPNLMQPKILPWQKGRLTAYIKWFLLLTPVMIVAHPIQFTQEQARTLSAVTPEAWRHWRSVIPYLASKRGKAARFSIGDIVALSVTQEAVQGLGISVSRLSTGLDHLFHQFATERPSVLANSVALIMPSRTVLATGDDLAMAVGQLAIAVACGPIVERLSAGTFQIVAEDFQPALPFPPRVIGGAG